MSAKLNIGTYEIVVIMTYEVSPMLNCWSVVSTTLLNQENTYSCNIAFKIIPCTLASISDENTSVALFLLILTSRQYILLDDIKEPLFEAHGKSIEFRNTD